MPADHELHITPIYVLTKLEEHTKECGGRWRALATLVITNLLVMVIGMAGLIVTMLTHQH